MRSTFVFIFVVFMSMPYGCSTLSVQSDSSKPLLSGIWSGELRTADGGYVEQFNLQIDQSGDILTGTATDEHGETAQAKGRIVEMQVGIALWNKQGFAEFTGTPAGNKIKGSWTMGNESGPFWISRE